MPPQNPDRVMEGASESSSAGTVRRFISGVGIVEPAGGAISIGSQLSGIVTAVFIQPGDTIRKGSPLFALDERTARANVAVAKTKLAADEAKLLELKAQIPTQESRVDAAIAVLSLADAKLKSAQNERERAERLSKAKAISAEELDQRRVNVALAEAQANEAKATLREAQSTLQLLKGNPISPTLNVQMIEIENARASLAREETFLSLHTVMAPLDCKVLQVNVRPGEFAPAAVLSTPLVTVGIADDLHLRVDIDEMDIYRFSPDSKAYASLRGRPDEQHQITFVRCEPYVIPKKTLTGSVSERVDTRVLQIIYRLESAVFEASPGQQVDVYIEERRR